MTDDDKLQFAAALRMLGRIHRQQVDDLLIEAYWLALEDVPLDEFRGRCMALLKEGGEWFPKPSQLRNRGADYRRDLAKRTEETRKRLEQGPPISQIWMQRHRELEQGPKRLTFCGLPQTEAPGLDSD